MSYLVLIPSSLSTEREKRACPTNSQAQENPARSPELIAEPGLAFCMGIHTHFSRSSCQGNWGLDTTASYLKLIFFFFFKKPEEMGGL